MVKMRSESGSSTHYNNNYYYSADFYKQKTILTKMTMTIMTTLEIFFIFSKNSC